MPRDTFFNLPEEKRARIMEEALDEFAAHPYGRASISQIARRARISKGAFYLYFRDKFDLYIYLLELGAEKKLEVLKEAVAPLEAEPDFLRVWRRIMEASMEFARDNPRLWAISNHLRRESDQDLLERVMARLAPQGEEFMGDWLLRSQEAGYVRADISPETVQYVIWTLMDRVAQDTARGGLSLEDMGEFVEEIMDLLEHGLRG